MAEVVRMTLPESLNWFQILCSSVAVISRESANRVDMWRMQIATDRLCGERFARKEPDPKKEPWAGNIAKAKEFAMALRRGLDEVMRGCDGVGKRIPASIDPDGAGWETRLKMHLRAAFQEASIAASRLPEDFGYGAPTFPERFWETATTIEKHLNAIAESRDVILALPPLPQHPAVTLYLELNNLHAICSNARLFRDLANRRKDAAKQRDKLLDMAVNDANRQAGEGKSPFKVIEELHAFGERLTPSNEPAELKTRLSEILNFGQIACERARAALRSGGAKVMDAALAPGTSARAVEIGVKLREAEVLFKGLFPAISNPQFLIDDDVKSMEAIAEWFCLCCNELGTILESQDVDDLLVPKMTTPPIPIPLPPGDGLNSPKPSAKQRKSRRQKQLEWLATAMLLVQDHPEWSDRAIAQHAGIDNSRLSRSQEYQAAARMARTPKTREGSVKIIDGVKTVEAFDDSFDSNRRASRQGQDEEDLDDRIDREMNETQRKTQHVPPKSPKKR